MKMLVNVCLRRQNTSNIKVSLRPQNVDHRPSNTRIQFCP